MFWLSGDFLYCQSPFGSPWRESGLLTLYILFPIIFSSHYFSTLFSQPNAVFSLYIVLQEYIDAHPETIILDPLPAIRTLLDRSKSYELIRRIEAYMQGRPNLCSLEAIIVTGEESRFPLEAGCGVWSSGFVPLALSLHGSTNTEAFLCHRIALWNPVLFFFHIHEGGLYLIKNTMWI